MNMEKLSEEKTLPKSIVFLDAEIILYHLSETWEYELFISVNFQQHEVYKERPARFEGASSVNLKKRVYGFWKGRRLHHNVRYDIIHYPEGSFILLSIKMLHCPKGSFILFVNQDDTLSERLFYRYCQLRLYDYPEGNQKITALSSFGTKDDIKS